MAEGKEDGVQVAFQDETIWATQKAMAELFDVSVPAISQHLKNIYESQIEFFIFTLTTLTTLTINTRVSIC